MAASPGGVVIRDRFDITVDAVSRVAWGDTCERSVPPGRRPDHWVPECQLLWERLARSATGPFTDLAL
jgi:hypothetical protein